MHHGAQDYLVKSETDSKWLSRSLRYAIERASFQAELLRREQQFRALIERAHDIVVLLSLDGSIRVPESCHRTGARLFAGGSGRERTSCDLVHPEDQERAAGILAQWPQEELGKRSR